MKAMEFLSESWFALEERAAGTCVAAANGHTIPGVVGPSAIVQQADRPEVLTHGTEEHLFDSPVGLAVRL